MFLPRWVPMILSFPGCVFPSPIFLLLAPYVCVSVPILLSLIECFLFSLDSYLIPHVSWYFLSLSVCLSLSLSLSLSLCLFLSIFISVRVVVLIRKRLAIFWNIFYSILSFFLFLLIPFYSLSRSISLSSCLLQSLVLKKLLGEKCPLKTSPTR